MKKATIAITVVLLLALISETVFLIILVKNRNELVVNMFNEQMKNVKLTNDITNITAEKDDLVKEKGGLDDQILSLKSQLAAITEENDSLIDSNELKAERIDSLLDEKEAINSKFMCAKTLKTVDFSNNKSVSDDLVKYVTQAKSTQEPVTAAFWNTVWTGEKYSIHTIEVESEKDNATYVWKFTVYYRGESYGDHENGVFYNDDQCWLYFN